MKSQKNKILIALSLFAAFCLQPAFSQKSRNNPLELYNQGLALEARENWFDAAQEFFQVVTLNPSYTDAWFHLADCNYRMGEFELALNYLLKAEELEKNNGAIENLKGMIFLALGRNEEAREIFNKILKTYPNDVNAHFGLAELELYDGKFSGAEQQYTEALRRQPSNRKALLSMALICAETERFSQAEKFLNQAMQLYSGEGEVHYLASLIQFMQGHISQAEKHVRICLELNKDFELGYQLLSAILYSEGRYADVIDISDFLISRNRNNGKAWYLKGIAQNKMGKPEDAVETWDAGLSVSPQDEMMRFHLELTARELLPLEDGRRKEWADYHLVNASQYESRFDKAGAVYEYQRALLLDPQNVKARLSYADVMEMNGMHELYLEQLAFVEENHPEAINQKLKDTIEGYKSLLGTTLAKKWNVEPFYLDKIRWNIAVFYVDSNTSFNHADSSRLTALAASDVFSGVAITSVKTQVTPVSGYSEAYKKARSSGFDYFILVSSSESEEDITLKAAMYTGRTGTPVLEGSWFATGNNRFSTVLRRFRNKVLEKLVVRGKILVRNGKLLLVDLGKSENVGKDFEFKIIKKGGLKISDTDGGLSYRDSDLAGSLVITNSGEEVSEAELVQHGFYDRVNVDDEIILVRLPEKDKSEGTEPVPNSDESGNTLVSNSEGQSILKEIKKNVEKPAIVEILRSIY